jgi:hypothetical protein
MDRVLETVNFEAKFSSLPEFRPSAAVAGGGGGVAAVPSSPQAGLGSKNMAASAFSSVSFSYHKFSIKLCENFILMQLLLRHTTCTGYVKI